MKKLFPIVVFALFWIGCGSDEEMMPEEMQSALCEIPANESLSTRIDFIKTSNTITAEDTLHVELASDTLIVRYQLGGKILSFDLELEEEELLYFRAFEGTGYSLNELYGTPPSGTANITLDTIEKVKCGKINGTLSHSNGEGSQSMSTTFRVYIDTIR